MICTTVNTKHKYYRIKLELCHFYPRQMWKNAKKKFTYFPLCYLHINLSKINTQSSKQNNKLITT